MKLFLVLQEPEFFGTAKSEIYVVAGSGEEAIRLIEERNEKYGMQENWKTSVTEVDLSAARVLAHRQRLVEDFPEHAGLTIPEIRKKRGY